jgi:hypothetical protein
MDDPLDQLRKRPKHPVAIGKGRWMVGGVRPTVHGGIAQNLEECEAAGAILEARERAAPNTNGIMGEDDRWPMAFFEADGSLERLPKTKFVSPLRVMTIQEVYDLETVFGVTEEEFIELTERKSQ